MDIFFYLQNLWIAAMLGGVLLILSTMWDSTTYQPPSFVRRLFRSFSELMLWFGLIGWWIGVSGGVAVITTVVFLFLIFGVVYQRFRIAEVRGLIALVLAGMERGISPVTSVVAYQREVGGRNRNQVSQLARALGAGMSFGRAAKLFLKAIPVENYMIFELGSSLGNTDEMNRHAKQFTDDDTSHDGHLDFFLGIFALICGFAILHVGIMCLLEWFVRPTIDDILSDFGIEPSLPTEYWWIEYFPHQAFLIVSIVLAPIALLLLSLLVFVRLNWISELPWGLRWIHGPVNECRLLNVLSTAVAADLPMHSVCDIAQRQFPSQRIRGISHRLYEELSKGGNWIDCLRKHGILNYGESALAKSAQDAGNLAWALREISVGKSRRYALRMAPLSRLILPLVVMGAGIPVLAAALRIVASMSQLVMNLS